MNIIVIKCTIHIYIQEFWKERRKLPTFEHTIPQYAKNEKNSAIFFGEKLKLFHSTSRGKIDFSLLKAKQYDFPLPKFCRVFYIDFSPLWD